MSDLKNKVRSSKRDRQWEEKFAQVKAIGVANLEKGTSIHRWYLRQMRLLAKHLQQQAVLPEKTSEGVES